MSRPWLRCRRKRRARETGAVAIIIALVMVALCVLAALVLDFGIIRFDKQANKAAADAATTAGIRAFDSGDGVVRPFQGSCEALNYLKANQPELSSMTDTWKYGTGAAVGYDPCSEFTPAWDLGCEPGSKATWAWYTGTVDKDGGADDFTVTIKSGYDLDDPVPISFAEEESVVGSDSGEPSLQGCDHLAVIVQERQRIHLGSLATDQEYLGTTVRSVGRVTIEEDGGHAAVALLLLERHDCLVIDIQGNSGARVLVQGNGDRPGMIHSDSLGDGDSCLGDDKIIDGDFGLPPRIWSEDAETGSNPGIIGVHALTGHPDAVPENAADAYPDKVFAEGQVNGAPEGREMIGRSPVDQRYLLPVSNLIDEAADLWNMSADTATGLGYTVLGCTPTSSTAPRVFVDCPGGISYNTTRTLTGDTIVYNGPVTVAGGTAALNLPNASDVFIKGSTSANGRGLSSTKAVRINDGGMSCTDRHSTAPSARASLVIGNGSLHTEGQASIRMCQTSVVMGDDNGDCPVPSSYDPEPYGLEPYDNSCDGLVHLAGQGDVDWTAPDVDDDNYDELEDLALWTESSGNPSDPDDISKIQGNGLLNLAGVFFLPNASPFRIAGNGGQEIGANAQFITRRLEVAGTGYLKMKPDPEDVVTVPYFGGFSLVR